MSILSFMKNYLMKISSFYGKYNHKNLDTILRDINLAIHIKYKDPCPNAIEKLQYGIPHIYSNSGGTPELIGKVDYQLM